jgi:hypothetical protein
VVLLFVKECISSAEIDVRFLSDLVRSASGGHGPDRQKSVKFLDSLTQHNLPIDTPSVFLKIGLNISKSKCVY